MDEGSHVTSKSTPPAKLTYADFMLFPDDGRRHELIDGEHYVTPSPSMRHQTISGRLYLAIAGFLEQHPLGQVWYKRFGIAEYWMADPESNAVTVYRSRGAEFETTGELTAEKADVLTTPLLPGLRIGLAHLFRD